MPSGIAKIAPRDNNLQADDNLVIIPANESLSFGVSLYSATKDIKKVTKEIKWIWVEAEYLDQLREIPKEVKFEHWGKWSGENKILLRIYGIGIDYAKSSAVNISNVSKQKHLVGKKYWLEAFVYYPEFKHPVGKYFVVKGTPCILNAYFEGIAIGNDYNLIKSKYGKTVNLLLDTHLLPDVSVNYHNYVVFEVDIYNHEKNKKVTKDPIRSVVDFAKETKDFNSKIKIAIIIEDTWRSDAGHNNSDEVRNYYAVIKATHYFNKDAVYEGKAKSNGLFGNAEGTSFRQQSPNGELVAYTITKEDWEKNHWMEYIFGRSLSDVKKSAAKYESTEITFKTIDSKGEQLPVYIEVPYTTQSEAIEARNIEAGKMLAEVKDKKYTCKKYDPCKFTGIEVLVGKNKPTVIFNEEELSDQEITDNTTKVFSFVAGDSKKETVKITLKDLIITDYGNESGEIKCIAPEPHTIKNLIDATKVSPQWLVEKDTVSDKKYSTYEIKENTILLEMGYMFNKSYDNSVLDYLAFEQDYIKKGLLKDKIANLWVVRYLLKMIKNEKLGQPYHIPINTCRYPAQVINMLVYPDLKWVINFNYNINTPIYYANTEAKATYSARFHKGVDDYGRPLLVSSNTRERKKILDKEISNSLVSFVGQETKFEIGVQCQISDSAVLDLNKLFERKFQSMLAPLMWIHDFIDGTFGVSDAKKIEDNVKKQKVGKFNKLLKRLNKLPMSFELTSPKVAVGIGIGYGNATNNNVGYELEGKLLMNPIIGANIKLDVLALGSKFKPWGAIIDALDLVSFATNLFSGGRVEIDYRIDIIFTAEILLVSSESKDGEAKPANLKYSLLNKKFTSGDIGLQGRLKGKIEIEFGIKLKGKIKDAKSDKDIVAKEKIEKPKELGGLGLEMKADSEIHITLGTSFGKGDNFNADFYFSGVTLTARIKIGRKWKGITESIIPDFDKKFDILKNKGEYK
ncbi:hypothetical protein ACSTS3_10685 [Aquimarina muelleri]|uniref:hypothetical protein n=1 Tax=Aquimarina muelleri TaxID=279356 RepID=UPI003F68607F